MSGIMGKQILSHVPESTQNDIKKLFKNVDNNKEFEFIFFSKKGQNMNKEKQQFLEKMLLQQNQGPLQSNYRIYL